MNTALFCRMGRKRKRSYRRGAVKRRRVQRLRYPNKERKWHDVALSDTSTQAWQFISLNLVAQGVTESQRIGRKLWVKTVRMKGLITSSSVADAATLAGCSDVMRFMVLLDKQCNGALPTGTITFQTDVWNSFRNMENASRYEALYDKTVNVKPNAAAGTAAANDVEPGLFGCHFNLTGLNVPVEFSSDTGAIGTIRSNNLVFCYASANAFAKFNLTKFRVMFTD